MPGGDVRAGTSGRGRPGAASPRACAMRLHNDNRRLRARDVGDADASVVPSGVPWNCVAAKPPRPVGLGVDQRASATTGMGRLVQQSTPDAATGLSSAGGVLGAVSPSPRCAGGARCAQLTQPPRVPGRSSLLVGGSIRSRFAAHRDSGTGQCRHGGGVESLPLPPLSPLPIHRRTAKAVRSGRPMLRTEIRPDSPGSLTGRPAGARQSPCRRA